MREFGIVLWLNGLELAGSDADHRRGIVDTSIVLSRESIEGPCHSEEPVILGE